MVVTSSNVGPEASSAAIVFSKFGASEEPAILEMAWRFRSIAARSAGLNCSTFTFENGGTPPYGPVHASSSELGARGIVGAALETGGAAGAELGAGGVAAPPPGEPAAHAAERKAAGKQKLFMGPSPRAKARKPA